MHVMRSHRYLSRIIWDGNLGDGTSNYTAYGRQYRAVIDGKPELSGSADPAFRGEPDKYNPEDLFVTAISACHMLTYLALCARSGIHVTAYEDEASGSMVLDASGGGKFEEITLRPAVTISGGDATRAAKLHETAHQQCFIANSCSVPIRHEATIQFAEGS